MMTKAFVLCHLEIFKEKISTDTTFHLATGNVKLSTLNITKAYKNISH